jgi:uncharacterized protein YejL (UPF0352 family)
MLVEIYFVFPKHTAPLGLDFILISVFNKHLAPLGLFL